MWIGAKRVDGGKRYHINWLHTNRRVGKDYTNWHSKEPSKPVAGYECISMKNGNLWFDNKCTKAYYFICEY